MPYGNVSVDTVTTSTAGGILGAGDASSMKNRIINGAMVISQRNGTSSGTASDYTVDRWNYSASQASKGTWQQNAGSVTPPVGFTNYLGFTSSSAYSVGATDYFSWYQPIEGYNTSDLSWGTANGKTITISAWVYSSLTGTFGGAISNSAYNYFYPFSYTISAANTWTQISVTIAAPPNGSAWVTNNGIGIRVNFGLGVGSTYSNTAGTWTTSVSVSCTGATSVVGTNGATFYITGVQLEVGSSATGFEYRQYTTELQLCQRYYAKSYDIATTAGAVTNVGAYWSTGTVDSGGNGYITVRYPVSMRTAPTVTTYTGATSGSWSYERSGASGTASTSVDSNASGGSRFYLNTGATAYTGALIYGQWIASAEL